MYGGRDAARAVCLAHQANAGSPAYWWFDAESKKWRSYTWQETGVLAGRWKRALAQEISAPGERVGILLRNSVEWVCFDQAALALGLVVVPLYPSDAPDNIAYILADSGVRLLLMGTQRRWETLAPLCSNLTVWGRCYASNILSRLPVTG